MRALPGRGFDHAGAQPRPAHLHQSERADAADLDARAIVLERLLHRLLDLSHVRTVIHVDEVDDDEPGHVAQAKLAGDLVRGLEIRSEEHTSELQSLMRISYAVFCLKKKKNTR